MFLWKDLFFVSYFTKKAYILGYLRIYTRVNLCTTKKKSGKTKKTKKKVTIGETMNKFGKGKQLYPLQKEKWNTMAKKKGKKAKNKQ